MVRIVLVRHGQTAWNQGSQSGEHFRGRVDIDLNPVGLAQARSIAACLAPLRIGAVYASPLKRAIGTAKPIAEAHGLTVKPFQGLLDIDYGRWGGLSHGDVAARWPELYRQWQTSPHQVQIPGGESLTDVRRRVRGGLVEIRERHSDEIVVLVGHQAVNKVLICSLLGLDDSAFWRIRQDTGCISRFDCDGTVATVLTLNEVCHLPSRPPGLDEIPGR